MGESRLEYTQIPSFAGAANVLSRWSLARALNGSTNECSNSLYDKSFSMAL